LLAGSEENPGVEWPGKETGVKVKVIGVQTSPNLDGLTATMAKRALAGARKAGAETALIPLRKLEIAACLACEQGWGRCRREGLCIIEDDFEKVRGALAESQALVLSTPVYFGEVSEIAKNFLDRLRRCERAGPGEPRTQGLFVLGIAAAGGGGGGGPSCQVIMERYCVTLQWRIFDMMTVTRRSREYMLRAARAAGAALVEFVRTEAKRAK